MYSTINSDDGSPSPITTLYHYVWTCKLPEPQLVFANMTQVWHLPVLPFEMILTFKAIKSKNLVWYPQIAQCLTHGFFGSGSNEVAHPSDNEVYEFINEVIIGAPKE